MYLKVYFFFFWLRWVLASVRGLPPVAASGGHSSLRCAGLSPPRPLPLRITGSRRAGSAIVAHRPSRSAACGTPPDQGSNPCPLHRQADPQPLRHQGSPLKVYFYCIIILSCWILSCPRKCLYHVKNYHMNEVMIVLLSHIS